MKKFIILLLLSLLFIVFLSGCAIGSKGDLVTGEERIEEKIDKIKIEWTYGNVEVVYHDENYISAIEESDKLTMECTVSGTTLHIKNDILVNFGFVFNSPRKTLTLSLPKSLVLEELNITTTSADVNIDKINSKKTDINTTSGIIEADLSSEETVSIGSVSGSISLNTDSNIDSLKLQSTSGEINAALCEVNDAEFGTVSGDIDVVSEKITESETSTTSGKISMKMSASPNECEIGTVTGRIKLYLPENPGFTANISTVSGKIESDFDMNKDGNIYTYGDGGAELKIDTTSGDIKLEKIQ